MMSWSRRQAVRAHDRMTGRCQERPNAVIVGRSPNGPLSGLSDRSTMTAGYLLAPLQRDMNNAGSLRWGVGFLGVRVDQRRAKSILRSNAPSSVRMA